MKIFKNKSLYSFRNLTTRGAFTLIELLIVIGIIAILAGAVVIAISPGERLASARDATRERHVQAIEQAVLSYQVDNEGNFPEALDNSLGAEVCNTNLENPDCEDLIDLSTLTEEGYLSSLPLNPGKEEESQGIGYKIATVNHKLAVWPVESEARRIGKRPCLKFSKDGSYLRVPHSAELNSLEFSIVLWLKTSDESNEWGRQVGKWSPGWWLMTRGGGETDARWRMRDEDGERWGEFTFSYPSDEWTQLTFTVGNEHTRGYHNKEKIREVYVGDEEKWWEPSDDHLQIGHSGYKGKIESVLLFDREIVGYEIEKLYQGQVITEGLVGYWPLNEGEGETAYDYSGNDNHGAFIGNPQWAIER